MTLVSTAIATGGPVSGAIDRRGNFYVVNGLQRGFRYNGSSLQNIGITAAPSVSAASVTPPLYYVSGVVVDDPGENYITPPTVSIVGVIGARAIVVGSQVDEITIQSSATTHTTAPAVGLTGGQASGGAVAITNGGAVAEVAVNPRSAGYASPPAVTFYANTQNVTAVNVFSTAATTHVNAVRQAQGFAVLNRGRASAVIVTDPGYYEVSPSLSPGRPPVFAVMEADTFGLGATASCDVLFRGCALSIAISSAGTEYSTPPDVKIIPAGRVLTGSGAMAEVDVGGGKLSAATINQRGSGYDGLIQAALLSPKAMASATVRPRLSGKYLCGVRFVDSTPASKGGPNFGDLSELVEVDCGEGARSITWTGIPTTSSDSRVTHVELWRTTSDQAITLYRIAKLAIGSASTYTDSIPDDQLLSLEDPNAVVSLPVLTADGYPNARRFGVPPSHMSVVCMFQDRAWYAVSSTEPNTIYFSEVDEPESVPSEYQIGIQQAGKDSDSIKAMFTMDSSLYVAQARNLYRINVSGHPLDGASAAQVAQRGALNSRCVDTFDGVAYMADSYGLYAFDGSRPEPLSDPVSTFWSDPVIDFAKSKWAFVHVDQELRVVRFYFCQVGVAGQYPNRALCYSLVTKAWWTETYAHGMAAGATASLNGKQTAILGSGAGSVARVLRLNTGLLDIDDQISYSIKTGNFPLNESGRRGLRLTYTPTPSLQNLSVRCYYNGSVNARPNAVAVDRGGEFVATEGASDAVINMATGRSPLAASNGYAQMYLSGRLDDRSVGADRDIAIQLSGTQGSGQMIVHRLAIEGAGQ